MEPPLGGDGICQSPQASLWTVGPGLVVVKCCCAEGGEQTIKSRIPVLLKGQLGDLKSTLQTLPTITIHQSYLHTWPYLPPFCLSYLSYWLYYW